MENSVRQRIKQFIEDKNLSINALSKGNSALQRKLQRQINEGANVTVDTIEYLQNFCPQLNSDWLLRGVCHILNEDNDVTLQAGTDGIPFYDRTIECGTPADFNACIEADKADGRIMLPNIQGDFLPLHNICTTFFLWGLFLTAVGSFLQGSFLRGVFFSSSGLPRPWRCCRPPGRCIGNTTSLPR